MVVKPSTLSLPDLSCAQAFVSHIQTLDPNVGETLRNLKLNPEGSSGEFRPEVEDLENRAVDALILSSILRLSPMSLFSEVLLAEYRLYSLDSMTVSTRPHQSRREHFVTRIKTSESGFVESDSEIHQDGKLISLQGMRYQAAKILHREPAPESLFFKPVQLPDITRLSTTEPMSISRCAQLLSHKWPSCDIKLDDIPEQFTASILKAFGASYHGARSFFRSIKCFSKSPDVISDRVQLVDGSDVSSKYHMIFAQKDCAVAQMSHQLRAEGFLCIPKAHMKDLRSNQSASLEVVCHITGLGHDKWVLLRRTLILKPKCTSRRIVVFANQHNLHTFNNFEGMESVPLEPIPVACFRKQNSFTRFDAVIIDHREKPVITSWSGSDLMP